MNKYAQVKGGKIIYFYQTDLSIGELTSIFSPKTFWVDVTDKECGLGWEVSYNSDCEMVLTAPTAPTTPTFEQLKSQKLLDVDSWTASKITGGFVSYASGEAVTYDSDKDTQLTMQGIALNVGTPLFAEKYPKGCPVRGYAEGAETKSIFMLNSEQVLQWCADLSMHIGNCKQEGWVKQAEVNACTTKEELDSIKWDEENSV